MKLLCTTTDRVILQLLKDHLESNEVAFLIKNEQPPLVGEIPPIVAPPEIWILREEDYPEALRILTETTNPHVGAEWRCRHCRSENPAEFLVCWNCSKAKSETEKLN